MNIHITIAINPHTRFKFTPASVLISVSVRLPDVALYRKPSWHPCIMNKDTRHWCDKGVSWFRWLMPRGWKIRKDPPLIENSFSSACSSVAWLKLTIFSIFELCKLTFCGKPILEPLEASDSWRVSRVYTEFWQQYACMPQFRQLRPLPLSLR